MGERGGVYPRPLIEALKGRRRLLRLRGRPLP
jgi:hypothetical protein